MEPGPNDVPAPCAKCGGTQLHRRDDAGALHCLRCLTAPGGGSSEPLRVEMRPRQMSLADSFRGAVVFLVLLGVIIAVYAKACSYR